VQPWRKYLKAEKESDQQEKASWAPEEAKPWEKPWIEWRSQLPANNPDTQGS
jgi:hypothetical protein